MGFLCFFLVFGFCLGGVPGLLVTSWVLQGQCSASNGLQASPHVESKLRPMESSFLPCSGHWTNVGNLGIAAVPGTRAMFTLLELE